MTDKTTTELVEALRTALETRNYTDFVDLFATDGIYEIPFALDGNATRYEGIEKIRDRFNVIGQSPMAKLIDLHNVSANLIQSTDPNLVIVEFSMEGTSVSTGQSFQLPSSIAIIRCRAGKVIHYSDYPNSAGIAKMAGVLPQFAASLTR